MSRWLTNGRLGNAMVVDIELDAAGSVVSLAEHGTITPTGEVDDLQGWLVMPALAEPHAHLDKALTAEAVPNPSGDLMGAIEAWRSAEPSGVFEHDDLVQRSTNALEKLLVSGVTAVRSHVDVGAEHGASGVVAVRQAADAMTGLVDVQLVALTHCPMTGADGTGNRAALVAALEAGVDLVGGCPHLDPDGARLIDDVLSVASEAGLPIDLHVDEMLDPDVLFLRTLARRVIESGFPHAVTASHCVTLGMQDTATQAAVAAEVAEAGISIVPLPQTNLFLQGRDHPTATPRGLTAIKALQDAGVVIAAGADNVQDPFNSVGRSDPLETAALLVMAGHQLPQTAFDMVSDNVRLALGLAATDLVPGSPADLLVIDAPSVRAAIADAPMSRRTYKQGRLVASVDHSPQVHR